MLTVAGFYVVAKKGPMRVDPRALDSISIGNPEVERLRSEAVTLYQEIVELHRQRPFTREDIPLIEAATDALDPVLRSSDGVLPADEKLLNELKRFKAAIKGRLLREQSDSLEAEGELQEKEGHSVAAVSAFRKAAQLQRTINKQYPESEDRDHRRAAALFNRGFDLMARPLFESSSSEEQAARGHFQERRWKQAEQHMKEAISLQRELNEDHSRSRFAHHERLQRLEVGLASMQSGRASTEVDTRISKAAEAEKQGDFQEAARLYVEARQLQELLNRSHQDNEFASARKVEDIEILRQDAMSLDLARRIRDQDIRISEYLALGRVHLALREIAALADTLYRFQSAYPKSRDVHPDLFARIELLDSVKEEISRLQADIRDQLISIPDEDDWLMLRTEVWQGLYIRIMRANPSRHAGERKPVDSVTYEEAMEFSRRVGWILGREARLPKRGEFESGIGDVFRTALLHGVWHASNSRGQTRPVAESPANQHSFHDLLGNVSEWLWSFEPDFPDRAWLGGGSARDSVDALAQIPYQPREKTHRNRMSGFRVVVRRPSSIALSDSIDEDG